MTPAEKITEKISSDDAVFLGRVTSVVQGTFDVSFHHRVATLQIEESWKGTESKVIEIHTSMGGGDCGFPFEAEQSYLIYASMIEDRSPNHLWTSICDGNQFLENAEEELTYLRANHETINQIRILLAFIASFLDSA